MPAPQFTDIVFDGPPGPECGRFVEVENEHGESFGLGKWVERDDGYWVIRFTPRDAAPELYSALVAVVSAWEGKSGMGTMYEMQRAIPDARAALAKAQGES